MNDPSWVNLVVHNNDSSLDQGEFSYVTYPKQLLRISVVVLLPTRYAIPQPVNGAFRYFRVIQTGKNAFQERNTDPNSDEWSDALVVCGFELYGTLHSMQPDRFGSSLRTYFLPNQFCVSVTM